MDVLPIKAFECPAWLLEKHYAKRVPCITHAFGLYESMLLVGVVTFGPTPTPAVQEHMLGSKYRDKIIELNRLVVHTSTKNAASYLVSSAMRLLPSPLCVISYADTKHGHVGYIYQACNFIYTGAVTAHDAEYSINGKSVHARTLTAQGITAPKEWARANGVEIIKPCPKHRYLFFIGSRLQKKAMRAACTYPLDLPFPKGETRRYDAGGDVPTQVVMF